MKKRDFIEEIISVKERSNFYGRTELQTRILEIDIALREQIEYNDNLNKELLKYIPVATVACFESFFRTIVADLIENSHEYRQNVTKFNAAKSIKFDFNIVTAIQKEKITVGDFVAHFLSCNNLKDFTSNLSILLQEDFLESLKKFKPNSIIQSTLENSKILSKNFPRIINSVNRVFELRHIFCHEFATNFKIDPEEIKTIYEDSKIFLDQVNEFIWFLLEPNAPQNQMEMNIQAGEDLEKSNSELEKIIDRVKESEKNKPYSNFEVNKFDSVISKWKEYRDMKSNFDADSFYREGSIQPLIRLTEEKKITDEFIKDLKEKYL